MRKKTTPILRVINILKELYSLKKLHISQVALTYNVSTKTIGRDFKTINQVIPLERSKGYYWISPTSLQKSQKLPTKLLQSFAKNANIEIDCFSNSYENISIISFAIAYNKIDKTIAEAIINSIEKNKRCKFSYTNNKNQLSLKDVSPIKLFTQKGKWYLVAKDTKDNKIKSFDFKKIKNFKISNNNNSLTDKDINFAKNISSVWTTHNAKEFEVILYVDNYAKNYIEDIPLHKSQKLHLLLSDGGAEYKYKITHHMELLPQIKEWIPHIYILKPKNLQEMLKKDINIYLNNLKFL